MTIRHGFDPGVSLAEGKTEPQRRRSLFGSTVCLPDISRRYQISKRVLDLAIAIPLIVFSGPLMLFSALLVRLTSEGPALFRQTRVGRNGRFFTLLKLRTMSVRNDDREHRAFTTRELRGEIDDAEADGIFKLDRDPRITGIGDVLRRYSIDELPQLLNVVRGDMSLVGPRPSLPWEVELYTDEQTRRHECLPGITGLWQVSGRSRLSVSEMLKLDLAYVEQRSLRLDLWILLRTPYVALFCRETR
jgi:lipopolysaccharide/colanic/teichoic acid biosynthesis glycosyltransferase